MKAFLVISLVGALGSMAGCVATQPTAEPARRASMDYAPVGPAGSVSAFIYGSHTVVDVPDRLVWVGIYDERGEAVPYDRVGRYYRVKRKLGDFTVRVNASHYAFTRVVPQVVASASQRPVKLQAFTETAPNKSVRPYAAERMLYARFGRLSTTPMLTADVEQALVLMAQDASIIELRGHTDSTVAGPRDASIAQGRAESLRDLLVGRGVAPERISTSSAAAGEFLVENKTAYGKSLNRRTDVRLRADPPAQGE